MQFETDKIGHGYLPEYLKIASIIGSIGTVVEIGVASGASLHMWQALFPHGHIIGVDRHQPANMPTSVENGATVQFIQSEQDDPQLPGKIEPFGDRVIDLIVDDASHDSGLTEATLRNLWPLIGPQGFYVIEDWTHCGMMMGDLARTLISSLDERKDYRTIPYVKSITYRSGMIIIQK